MDDNRVVFGNKLKILKNIYFNCKMTIFNF